VVAASRSNAEHGRESLARLCQSYWFPLYAYVRRRGYPPEDSQDLTQAFFARLVEKNWVADADRSKGRFRTFLLTAMKHFLADEWDRARADKRGGGVTPLPLSFDTAEARYNEEPADSETPERIYERRWAVALLGEVLNRLRTEYEDEGKGALFAALDPCLVGERTRQPYAELAESLNATEPAIKSAVHRLRQRYRQLLREEVAGTVDSADEVEDELRHLFAALTS
jgi:RNA polymerase sigma-70 factor (ECF subfamily)